MRYLANSRRAETTDIVLLTVLVDQTNTPGGGQESERYNTPPTTSFPKDSNRLFAYLCIGTMFFKVYRSLFNIVGAKNESDFVKMLLLTEVCTDKSMETLLFIIEVLILKYGIFNFVKYFF